MAKEDGYKNLVPFNRLSEDEQRRIRSKGGEASVEARRAKKTLRETLKTLLEMDDYTTDRNGENKPCDGYTAVSVALLKKALTGDVGAITALRDSVGEKPTDKVGIEGDGAFKLELTVEGVDKDSK